MSKKQSPPSSFFTQLLTCILVVGVFIYVPFYLYASENLAAASEDVWSYLKQVVLIVIAYWFGASSSPR